MLALDVDSVVVFTVLMAGVLVVVMMVVVGRTEGDLAVVAVVVVAGRMNGQTPLLLIISMIVSSLSKFSTKK